MSVDLRYIGEFLLFLAGLAGICTVAIAMLTDPDRFSRLLDYFSVTMLMAVCMIPFGVEFVYLKKEGK